MILALLQLAVVLSGVIVLPLERHAQNEADRKNMLKEMDATRDHVKQLLKEVPYITLHPLPLNSVLCRTRL